VEGITRVSQMQRRKILDDGDAHDVVEISFYVDTQGPFSLDVLVESYAPETATRMIEDYAKRIRATRVNLEA